MLRDELLGLQMKVAFGSLGLEALEREVIKMNKALFKKLAVLQKIVIDRQESRAVSEEKLTKLKSSVLSSDWLAAKLTGYNIS